MNQSKSNNVLIFLVALIGLTAFTWAIGLLDIQYKSETRLAFASGFPGDAKQWKLAGDPINITLTPESVRINRVSEKHSYAMRQFPLPPEKDLLDRQLRVRGDISTLKQASTRKVNEVAAYMIWFQDQNGKTIQYMTVQALTGDFSEYRAERIVTVPSGARSFYTVLINRDSDGSFELTNANVTLVKATLLYQLIRPVVFVLWFCLVLLAVSWLILKGGYKTGISIGIFLALTLIGVLMPESVTNNYIFPTYKKLTEALQLAHSEPLGIYYKAGHFLFFFALSLMLIINRQQLRLSVWIILLLMLIFAVATEGLQLHLYNRSTRLSDIGIDIAGIALAILFGLCLPARNKNTIHTNDGQLG